MTYASNNKIFCGIPVADPAARHAPSWKKSTLVNGASVVMDLTGLATKDAHI